jgi:hypothetical protein
MGLQKEIEFDNGIILENGYSVIYKITQNIFPTETIEISVKVYYNKQMFDEKKPAVKKVKYNTKTGIFFNDFELNKSDQTLLKQAYKYLKSLSIYNGAIEI